MEKLQAALKKAREQRETSLPDAATGLKTSGGETGKADPIQTLWEQIPLYKPDEKKLVDRRILTVASGNEQAASFDLLRTKIQLQMEKSGWTRLAITSPKKSSGKTTICANIAFALSRLQSKRTLVFELDMRRPAMAATFGLEPEHSTAALLRGEVDLAEQAIRIGPNVAVSCNPGPLRSPSDLFLDPKVTAKLKKLQRTYAPDLMIFDLPPLYAGDDATAYFPNVD
jgi:Mrp family chromosome partitioning ATPase